jgi:diadenosine tetraphosphate (Ap4A) HIT family hydrolase
MPPASIARPPEGGCRFCDVARRAGSSPSDSVLFATANYSVVASVGAIVPGWLLILPRQHSLNLAGQYADEELTRLRRAVARRVTTEFGSPARMFEHGSAHTGSGTGCGIDHAHMHLVPLSASLLPFMRGEHHLAWEPTRMSQIRPLPAGEEFLFYCDDPERPDPNGYIAMLAAPRSQFFRRMVARSLGREEHYDYRHNPCNENVRITQTRLSARNLAAMTAP